MELQQLLLSPSTTLFSSGVQLDLNQRMTGGEKMEQTKHGCFQDFK